jgi:hypothetical protein
MHTPLQLASNEDQRIVAGAAVDVIGRQDAESIVGVSGFQW